MFEVDHPYQLRVYKNIKFHKKRSSRFGEVSLLNLGHENYVHKDLRIKRNYCIRTQR